MGVLLRITVIIILGLNSLFPFQNAADATSLKRILTAGSLDSSFSQDGIRVDGLGRGIDEINAIVLQPDGKIVAVGTSTEGIIVEAVVVRYLEDGSPDLSFGENGRKFLGTRMENAYAVAVQSDGRMVVAGFVTVNRYADFAVARLNGDGSPDTSFDADGFMSTPITQKNDVAYGIAVQEDGKIVVGGIDENPNLPGFNEFAMVRLSSDGSLDSSFGVGGRRTVINTTSTGCRSVLLQSDGKIVGVGGGPSGAAVIRLTTTGSLDSTFDSDGIAYVPSFTFNAGALQSDGKVVAVGSNSFNSIDFAAFRFSTNGALDSTFDGDGIVQLPDVANTRMANAVAIGTDGKILVVGGGESYDIVSVRFDALGAIDPSFGSSGISRFTFGSAHSINGRGVAIQSDGRILAAGDFRATNSSSDLLIYRTMANGQLDMSFDGDGYRLDDLGNDALTVADVKVDAAGRILVAGHHFVTAPVSSNRNCFLFRYLANGDPDPTFGIGGKVSIGIFENVDDVLSEIALQSDGKIVLTGYIFSASSAQVLVVRLNRDGALDQTFGNQGYVATDVTGLQDKGISVSVSLTGKIVVGGLSGSASSLDAFVVVYNVDGNLDTQFNGTGIKVIPIVVGSDDVLSKVIVQSDGKIVAAGNGAGSASLTRLLPDGSFDPAFGTDGRILTRLGTPPCRIMDAVLQSDGKFVVVGFLFGTPNSLVAARFLSDGSIDPEFGDSGVRTVNDPTSSYLNAVAIQSDGKILGGGYGTVGQTSQIDILTVRFDRDGNLDPNWGNAGMTMVDVSMNDDRAVASVIDQEGRFIVAGPVAGLSGVARFTADQRRVAFDFDGDGRSDISIYRPSLGQWWLNQSTDGVMAVTFGDISDTIVPADFTGDGKADVAIWRSGEWFVLRSGDFTFYSFPFGSPGDVPVVGDYDGDGKADAGIFRPTNSTWYISLSSGGTRIESFGADGDRPVPADYDGDGKTDVAIFRPSAGEWWLNRSSAGILALTFGIASDRNVPGDFTGDGKSDVAVFRPSTGEWFVLRSEDFSYYSFPFGASGDIPVPADYDGDGRTDPGVFRPSGSTWYLNRSASGLLIEGFGISSDRPVPSANVR